MARAEGMASHGASIQWKSALTRKTTLNTLWKIEPIRIQFTICSTYDLLPAPLYLMRCGRSDDAECGLCSKPGHLEHILSSCRTAFTQRRFTWRHDKVLQKMTHHIELKRVNANKSETKRAKEVRIGQKARKRNVIKNTEHSVDLLNRATDWELRVDLDKLLIFPFEIETRLRPAMIIYSIANKLLNIIERTVT